MFGPRPRIECVAFAARKENTDAKYRGETKGHTMGRLSWNDQSYEDSSPLGQTPCHGSKDNRCEIKQQRQQFERIECNSIYNSVHLRVSVL